MREPLDRKNKLIEAQDLFRRVVQMELQLLLDEQIPHEVAVKVLLQRIVKNTSEPSEAEVKQAMQKFQMLRDDAIRALIVKQEIGRLKLRGLDSFEAIEEITMKMQRLLPLSPRISENMDDGCINEEDDCFKTSTSCTPLSLASNSDETTKFPSPTDSEVFHTTDSAIVFDAVDISTFCEHGKRSRHNSFQRVGCFSPANGAAENVSTSGHSSLPSVFVDCAENSSWKEVSLCQRIGNVSISSSPKETDVFVSADTSTVLKKSRKRRIQLPSNKDSENEINVSPTASKSTSKSSSKSRHGANKKARLDVESKVKAQVGDGFVMLKSHSSQKSSKRLRPKSDAINEQIPKKNRVE